MKSREPKKTETLEVRLPPETKQAFMAACRANGVSASRVVRGLIRRHLRSASRAPIDWKRELEMLFTGKSRKAKLAGADRDQDGAITEGELAAWLTEIGRAHV